MTSITLHAPAKVNLFLRVLGKRKDSYHDLVTVFERIALADTITVSKIPLGIEVYCDKPVTRDPEDNIAYKAAKLMLASKKVRSGVRIRIKKRIPAAAGLGGGSSDAASVLLGINRLFGLKVPQNALIGLGAQLGADVPFFLLDTPCALGTSIGEKLRRVKLTKKLWHLIVVQGVKTSTKDMYAEFDRLVASKRGHGGRARCLPKCLTTKWRDDKMALPSDGSLDYSRAEAMLYNDLEEAVVGVNKNISSIIQRLASSQDKLAIVSGSGPSVFCLYRSRKEAIEGRKRLVGGIPASLRRGWKIFIVGTLT